MRLEFFAEFAFGGTLLAASFFAGLLVMFTGLEDLEDAFALDLLLQALQGLFQRFIFANLNFGHAYLPYLILWIWKCLKRAYYTQTPFRVKNAKDMETPSILPALRIFCFTAFDSFP